MPRTNKVRLVSKGVTKEGKRTKYTYSKTKNARTGKKLLIKKFDPRAFKDGKQGVHVLFEEEKMK